MTSSQDLQQNSETVAELLEHRAQLQEWLRRLDEFDDTPPQVAQRVRQDYEQRLEGVIIELGAHSEALTADRQRLDEALFAAAQRHEAASETLEEVRLRHRIGEISAEEWEERRPELEAELEVATDERAEVEREIAALDELLQQITAGVTNTPVDESVHAPSVALEEEEAFEAATRGASSASARHESDATPVADASQAGREPDRDEEPTAGGAMRQDSATVLAPVIGEDLDDDDDDDGIPEITRFGVADEGDDIEAADDTAEDRHVAVVDSAEPEPERDPDDYTFLEELDRAIAATAPGAANGAHQEDEATPETRPQPGLKCPACGYSNDASDWYCGVCGVDLA